MIQSNCRKKLYHMNYFTTIKSFFIVPSLEVYEEFEKIDKFIDILNKSEIGNLIEKEQNKNRKMVIISTI